MEIYYSNNYDYNSEASYGKNSLISSIGLTKGFFDLDDTSLSLSKYGSDKSTWIPVTWKNIYRN